MYYAVYLRRKQYKGMNDHPSQAALKALPKMVKDEIVPWPPQQTDMLAAGECAHTAQELHHLEQKIAKARVELAAMEARAETCRAILKE